MSKALYAGIEGIARKIKKMYVGVNGIARKVKKGYIGINGIARLFFAGGAPVYAGETTPLPNAISRFAGASVGKYAVFAGGSTSGSVSSTSVRTTAYDASQVQSTPEYLSQAVCELSGVSLSQYAIFAGGENESKQVVAYDMTLTKSVPATRLSVGRGYMPVARIGEYGVFGPGYSTVGSRSRAARTEAYNDELTHFSCPNVTDNNNCENSTGASNTNYAVFNGARTYNGGATKLTYALDSDLTLINSVQPSDQTGYSRAGATVGDGEYAVFAGGASSSFTMEHDEVFAYDTDLVYSNLSELTQGRCNAAALTMYGTAIFAGGQIDDEEGTSLIELYGPELTKEEGFTMQSARYELAGAIADEDVAFIAGGIVGGSTVSDADLILS